MVFGGEEFSERERVGEGRDLVEEGFEIVLGDEVGWCWYWDWGRDSGIEREKNGSGIESEVGIGSVKAGIESQSLVVLRFSLRVNGSECSSVVGG